MTETKAKTNNHMELNMSDLSSLVKMQPLPGIVVNDPVSKKPGLALFMASAVVAADGTTAEAHMASTDIHTSKAVIDADISAAVATAQTALSTALAELETLLNTFLDGAADGGDIDRLKELVAAINANKDSIDALLLDTINKADIVDDLATGGVGKVLSAEQGKTLKALIDTLGTNLGDVHNHANLADVLDKLSVADGKLKFDGGDVGEVRHWSRLVATVPTEWPADMHPSGVMLLTAATPSA